MSGSFIQALQRKPWEKHVQANAKSTFPAERTAVTDLGARQSRDGGTGLPMAALLGPKKPVIQWMSIYDAYRIINVPHGARHVGLQDVVG